jgi:hypothetical protein
MSLTEPYEFVASSSANTPSSVEGFEAEEYDVLVSCKFPWQKGAMELHQNVP